MNKRMINRLRHRITIPVHDLVTIPVAWMGAYWLRFNLGVIPEPYFTQALMALAIVIPIQSISFWYFGLYRGVWRFASMPDLVRILKAVLIGVGVSMAILFVFTRLQEVPRSIFPLYTILVTLFLGGPRFVYRWFKDYGIGISEGKLVLIVGAGQAGEMLARELLRDQGHQYQPLAFVDDDRTKHRKEIHGIRVRGNCNKIPSLVEDLSIEIIMLALPTATAKQMRRLVGLCEGTEAAFRTVPRVADLISGQVTINELRPVSIEDLLGRDPITLDACSITNGISGKRIMVTGAGGSIGSELCRQIADFKPAHLILFENSEFNLYTIEGELKERFPELLLACHLGDVSDTSAIEHVVKHYRPQVIFHAAAYKHVPMLEQQVREAVLNNVQGTRNVAEAAHRNKCERFILVSTDKAVNPTNVMGSTKRISEMVCQYFNAKSSTVFVTVRFGNVLGSAGSVVPLFRRQIEKGGPVTVTHPEMVRYFMTIPEACQLIMQTSVLATGGEIFVLDMGEPVTIRYLAEQLISLAGKIPNKDIDIVYTGLRPGEKLFEELFHGDELLIATGHKKILRADCRNIDYELLNQRLQILQKACVDYDEKELTKTVKELVPEYHGFEKEI